MLRNFAYSLQLLLRLQHIALRCSTSLLANHTYGYTFLDQVILIFY